MYIKEEFGPISSTYYNYRVRAVLRSAVSNVVRQQQIKVCESIFKIVTHTKVTKSTKSTKSTIPTLFFDLSEYVKGMHIVGISLRSWSC